MPGQMAHDVVASGGSKRDLSDVLTIVDAKECPFVSMVPKDGQGVDNLLMEWPVDENEEPGENAQVDGSDVTEFDNALDKYGVLQNRLQWFRRAALVGKLAQNAQNQAGIKDKLARSIAKKIIQLKRDMEIRFCGDGEAQVGTGAVPNKSRGIGAWIASAAQSIYPVPADYRTPAASIDATATGSMTEAKVQAVMTSQFQQTGQKSTYAMLCGTTFKGLFKDFQQTSAGSTDVQATVRVYNQNAASKKIVATVDVYEGDFGTYELIPSLWLAYLDANGAKQATTSACRAYALNMKNWKLTSKQRPQVERLPDQGGGPRALVDAICGLKCLNPLAEAKFNPTS